VANDSVTIAMPCGTVTASHSVILVIHEANIDRPGKGIRGAERRRCNDAGDRLNGHTAKQMDIIVA